MPSAAVPQPIDYVLKRWDAIAPPRRRPHLPDQQRAIAGAARICTWPQVMPLRRLERGIDRTAVMTTLITAPKLDGIDPLSGLPKCWRASPTSRNRACPTCFRGNGHCTCRPQPDAPSQAIPRSSKKAYSNSAPMTVSRSSLKPQDRSNEPPWFLAGAGGTAEKIRDASRVGGMASRLPRC